MTWLVELLGDALRSHIQSVHAVTDTLLSFKCTHQWQYAFVSDQEHLTIGLVYYRKQRLMVFDFSDV